MKKCLILLMAVFLWSPAAASMISDYVDFGGQVRFRGYDMQNMWDFDMDAGIKTEITGTPIAFTPASISRPPRRKMSWALSN